MLNLKKIILTNFLSHSKTEIAFSNPTKLLIDGNSGAGKSSIVDALVWALYNKSRSDGRSLIKYGKELAKVEVFLEEDNKNTYKIERTINTKGKHNLLITKKEGKGTFKLIEIIGIREQQEYLENVLLKSSYLLFINSVVYPQDAVENFVKQTAAKRKDIILEIAKAVNYDEYYKKTTSKIAEYESKLEHNNTVIAMLEESASEQKVVADKLDYFKKKSEEVEKEIKELKEELSILTKKETEMMIVRSSLSMKKNSRDVNEQALKKAEEEILFAEDNLKKSKDNNEVLLMKELLTINKNKKELQELNVAKELSNRWTEKRVKVLESKPAFVGFDEVKDISSQIDQLLSKKIVDCPEINKPCPILITERDVTQKELEQRLLTASKNKKTINILADEYDKKLQDLGEQPTVDLERVSELEQEIGRQEKIKTEIEESNKNREEKQFAIKTIITACVTQRATVTETIKTLSSEIKELESKAENFEENSEEKRKKEILLDEKETEEKESFAGLREASSSVKKLEISVEKLKKVVRVKKEEEDLLDATKLLKNAFGNNGIKAIIVDWIVPRLEDKINEILGGLSEFRIRIDTQKKSTSGDSTIEGLYVEIINEKGESFNFDSFSGGEKVKVCIAIFEGLASFQHCNFRLLDESIVSLDNESTNHFIEALVKPKEVIHQNINQLIVVSHIQEVKDSFIEKITIIKKNGDSVVE